MAQEQFDPGKYTIITGKLGTEERKDIVAILGADRIDYKYKLLFHWHNVIHELGHAILHFNPHKAMADVEEEPLVNDFAVAYWAHYGEEEKRRAFHEIVLAGLARFEPPVPAGVDHMAYARENWGKEGFFSFNNYGWFQFSCVLQSLQNPQPLATVLSRMTDNSIAPQPRELLHYDIEAEDVALQIVQDATQIARRWGVTLPALPHLLVDDPYRHGISTVGY